MTDASPRPRWPSTASASSISRASSPVRGARRPRRPRRRRHQGRAAGRDGTPAATTPAAGARRSCKRRAPARKPPRPRTTSARNRNKRSVTIDIATTEGCGAGAHSRGKADVLVENFKVGDLARHGLDAATLLARNPRLVYCSITGFGQTGPYRERAGYDYAIQGMGGLMSVTGPSRARSPTTPRAAGRRRSASRSPTSSPACTP